MTGLWCAAVAYGPKIKEKDVRAHDILNRSSSITRSLHFFDLSWAKLRDAREMILASAAQFDALVGTLCRRFLNEIKQYRRVAAHRGKLATSTPEFVQLAPPQLGTIRRRPADIASG
jgi:hypothetical protein